MRPLDKTIIIIWTDPHTLPDPDMWEIDQLSQEAIRGQAYCSKQETKLVIDPTLDPDWEDTEFFSDYKEFGEE